MYSRNLFVNLRRSVPRTGIEDFITEGLCWVLTTSREAERAFVSRLLPGVEPANAWVWSTQINFATAMSRSRPDMLGVSDTTVIGIESKVDAPVIDAQLVEHRKGIEAANREKKVFLALLAKKPSRSHPADQVLTWREIHHTLRSIRCTEQSIMVDQFVEFLGREGLGRIPGPCPTFWKASILEARRRDRDKGMARGYIDLGRKFAWSILPEALEELAESGEDEHLRAAIEEATTAANPERAVWRVCRTFFPSYLLRHDDRLGPLQIGDRQGIQFARGVVEQVAEEGLP